MTSKLLRIIVLVGTFFVTTSATTSNTNDNVSNLLLATFQAEEVKINTTTINNITISFQANDGGVSYDEGKEAWKFSSDTKTSSKNGGGFTLSSSGEKFGRVIIVGDSATQAVAQYFTPSSGRLYYRYLYGSEQLIWEGESTDTVSFKNTYNTESTKNLNFAKVDVWQPNVMFKDAKSIGGFYNDSGAKKQIVAFGFTVYVDDYMNVDSFGIDVYTNSECTGTPAFSKSSDDSTALSGGGKFYTILGDDESIVSNTTYYAIGYIDYYDEETETTQRYSSYSILEAQGNDKNEYTLK